MNSAVLEGARRKGLEPMVLGGVSVVPSVVWPGVTATLRANVSAVGPVTYQWLRDGVAISGANSAAYSITVAANSTNAYSVRVQYPGGFGLFERFGVAGPVLGVRVVDGLAYVAEGTAGVEIWDLRSAGLPVRLGGFDTPGEARAVDIVKSGGTLYAFIADGAAGVQSWDVTNPAAPRFLANRDDGTALAVSVGGERAYLSDPSGVQIVQLRSVPAVLQNPGSLTRNWGQSAQLQVVAEGAEPLRYQWLKNGVAIPGATGRTLTIPVVRPQDAGWYQAEISNNYTASDSDKALSSAAGLTVRSLPRLELSRTGAGRMAVPTVPVKRAFTFNRATSDELDDLGSLEPNGNSEALGLNDRGAGGGIGRTEWPAARHARDGWHGV